MNRWKIVFIFLTGFMVHEVMAHAWLGFEGLVPLSSKVLFGMVITPEINLWILGFDTVLLIICGYLGFLFNWDNRVHRSRSLRY